VGACASFLLAAMALSAEAAEWRAFAARSAPRINRLCIALACLIPLTGISNLVFATRAHHDLLPAAFVGVLSAKIGLFVAMALALSMAWRASASIAGENGPAGGVEAEATNIRRIVRFYMLIVMMGMLALGLGLWLSGT